MSVPVQTLLCIYRKGTLSHMTLLPTDTPAYLPTGFTQYIMEHPEMQTFVLNPL